MTAPGSNPNRATRTEIDRHLEAIRQAKAATLQGVEQQKERARQAIEIGRKAVVQRLAAEQQSRSPAPETEKTAPSPETAVDSKEEQLRLETIARVRALQNKWQQELQKNQDEFDRHVREMQQALATTQTTEVRAEAIARETAIARQDTEIRPEVGAETVAAYEGVLAAQQQVADLQAEMNRAIAQIQGEVAGAIEWLHGERAED